MSKSSKKYQENYVTVKIPKELANQIDDYIKNSKLGYRNRTELIIEIVRDKVVQLRQILDNFS